MKMRGSIETSFYGRPKKSTFFFIFFLVRANNKRGYREKLPTLCNITNTTWSWNRSCASPKRSSLHSCFNARLYKVTLRFSGSPNSLSLSPHHTNAFNLCPLLQFYCFFFFTRKKKTNRKKMQLIDLTSNFPPNYCHSSQVELFFFFNSFVQAERLW